MRGVAALTIRRNASNSTLTHTHTQRTSERRNPKTQRPRCTTVQTCRASAQPVAREDVAQANCCRAAAV
eukprot:572696-Pyramimonas_sp.AAC.2